MIDDLTPNTSQGQFILFQSDNGQTQVECLFKGESVWLNLNQLATLFDRDKSVISKHLSNIFDDNELEQKATVAKYATVQIEGSREVNRQLEYYNLDAILAVGYRVRSKQGVLFRQWSSRTLKEFLTKGFVMDDERLKNPESSHYFDELLNRIRDIRSSEKVFWRKVCDIYATSIDYDGKAQTSMQFFAQVPNKMHWATHGNTAAELVFKRISADKPHLGLSHFAGTEPTRKEVVTSKNYLSKDELDTLNRLVTSYLEFAELQAKRGKLMKMVNWTNKLDDFLRLAEYDILTHAGKISAVQAKNKAEQEYLKYRRVIDAEPSQVDTDLAEALKRLEQKQK